MSGLPVTAEGRAAFETLYEEKVRAVRDATPAPGRFPVLISAPGQGYPAFDNSVMAEFLASHGFIVIASPSMGPDGRDMPDSALAIDAESRDLEYLAGYRADRSPGGPGPHRRHRLQPRWIRLPRSFALRNARVKALVSLDGVLRDDRYLPTLRPFRSSGPNDCEPRSSGSPADPQLPARLRRGLLPGAGPTCRRREGRLPGPPPPRLLLDVEPAATPRRGSRKDWSSATASYEAASRLILAFLKSRLNGLDREAGPGARDALQGDRPSGRKAPPTPSRLPRGPGDGGFRVAPSSFRPFGGTSLTCSPRFEEPLVLAGYEALGAGDGKLAIQAFQLDRGDLPDSIDGSYGLGKAYLAEGSLEQADLSYGPPGPGGEEPRPTRGTEGRNPRPHRQDPEDIRARSARKP